MIYHSTIVTVVEPTKEDVKMTRIKLVKTNGWDGGGDYHIDGDGDKSYICRAGLAAFFNVGVSELESNIDLVITKRRTPNSFEVIVIKPDGWYGDYFSYLYIEGKNYGLCSNMERVIRSAADGADKFYIRVEV